MRGRGLCGHAHGDRRDGRRQDRLPALLAALTSAAVDGLVREVLIAGGGPPELLEVLREETGAELAADLAPAIAAARSERLLVLPAQDPPADRLAGALWAITCGAAAARR